METKFKTLEYEDAAGKWAESVCRIYFCYEKANIFQDKKGTDGFWNAKTIQIKADRKMKETNNFYKEVEEKTYPEQEWRISPNNAEVQINVADEYLVMATRHNIETAIKELGLKVVQIKKTSKGYLIPLDKLKHTKRVHGCIFPNTNADPSKLF